MALVDVLPLVHAAAWGSAFLQWPALFGRGGLQPVGAWLPTQPQRTWALVALQRATAALGGDADAACEATLLAGLALSACAVVLRGPLRALALLELWFLYLALHQAGRTFLAFQWDTLLLETTLACALACAADEGGAAQQGGRRTRTRTGEAVVRMLLFKLMLLSGAVKLQSGCPTWLGLEALDYHYATQCLPTPLAWFAHQLPAALQRASVAATLAIELPLALWLLAPTLRASLLGAVSQLLLQALISLSGNYCFFNWLTAALCLACLPARRGSTDAKGAGWRWAALDAALVAAPLAYVAAELLELAPGDEWPVRLKLTPARMEFHLSLLLGPLALAAAAVLAACAWLDAREGRPALPLLALLALGAACWTPMLAQLRAELLGQPLVPPAALQAYSDVMAGLGGVSYSYGLFRGMTGVGAQRNVARPEVVLEALGPGADARWRELEWPYKPGRLDRAPRFLAPYQPRLDWQLWFAALGSYHSAPWFVMLADKLLEGEPAVLALLDRDEQQEQGPAPIVAVRAWRYHVDFTRVAALEQLRSAKTRTAQPDAFNTSNWWWRLPGSKLEYLPEVRKGDASVRKFLEHHGLRTPPAPPPSAIQDALKTARRGLEPLVDVLLSPGLLLVVSAVLLACAR